MKTADLSGTLVLFHPHDKDLTAIYLIVAQDPTHLPIGDEKGWIFMLLLNANGLLFSYSFYKDFSLETEWSIL